MTSTNVTADKPEEASDEQPTPEQKEAWEKLMKLAEEQGVKPIDMDALLRMADFWPEDESVDEFIATIDQWRSEGHYGDTH